MSYNRNNNEQNNEQNNEEPEAWISHTKSGKGFIIYLGEKPNQTVLVGSKYHLDRFLDGKIKGVPLSKMEQKE